MRHELALLPTLLALAGCIQHRAAIDPSTHEPPATVVEVRGSGPALEEPIERADPLPLELRASAVRRDADGGLWRDEIALRTPLPWWQRFPVDFVTDLLIPRTFIVESRATIETHPVEPIDPETLLRLAREHGYAAGRPQALEE